MTEECIVYKDNNGLALVMPSGEVADALKDIPTGATHRTLAIDNLPEHPIDIWGEAYLATGLMPALGEHVPLIPLAPITRKQMIDVLIDHNLDEAVEPALEAIEDVTERKKALNAWQNATQYEPDHALILQMKTTLNLTDEEFQTMWREAMVL
ncbi:hypothetical protein SAMN04515647_1622 [Cohaesibacter sp. ES.047]|uniref:hypothetical protein n=1 Tax=Cohaesibacter sp. ES.047 TaxID=1798205 RepID=UPI000BB87CD4|nr:hypothetical protein [Cohaesibacter sp. ES.047]SNY91400.1 hypothetical protein SAMN04515647_1622 [Cohaesibacter sp. ES.047]